MLQLWPFSVRNYECLLCARTRANLWLFFTRLTLSQKPSTTNPRLWLLNSFNWESQEEIIHMQHNPVHSIKYKSQTWYSTINDKME
jgi:hypothetical protein